MLFAAFRLVFSNAVKRLCIPLVLGLIGLTIVVSVIAAVSGGAFLKAAIITAIAYVVISLVILVWQIHRGAERPLMTTRLAQDRAG